jgi:O-antigen ligase
MTTFTDTVFNHPVTLAFVIGLPLFGIVAKLFGASFKKISKWYLYIAVFAVLIVMDSIFFPFIGGKDYFFRFAVELSAIAFLLWWALEAQLGEFKKLFNARAKKPLFIAVTIFVAVFVLACLFAYDMHAAFWSNYERGEGGFQMIHYYLFFALLVFLLDKEKDWERIFQFSLVATGGMILYGILGNYSVSGFIGPYAGSTAPTGWWTILTSGRFQGSLGNPAYVAPYLMFSMFYAAYLWIRRKAAGTATKLTRWFYGVMIAIFVFFFTISQTRGAEIGLGVAAIVFVVYLMVAGRGKMRKWSAIALIALAAIGVAGYALRNNPAIEKIPEGRLLQISLNDTTAQTRFWVWGEAWKGFLERPILGWGPENFTAVFDKFFNPNFYAPGQNNETWFDRAHSVYFDYLSETGVLGLLAYLGMFGVFAYEFFSKKRRAKHEGSGHHNANILTRGLMLAMPVAYLVQGVAIFDVLPMYLSVFLFLAFSSYYFYENHGQNR